MKPITKNISYDIKTYEDIPKTLDSFWACYVRVSTDKQAEEGFGIDIQIDHIMRYCQFHDISNNYFFVDDGYTGVNMNRPALQVLLGYVKRQKVKGVIVMRLDRLGRSLKDILIMIDDWFKPNNCGFISCAENIETSTPMGQVVLAVLGSFAQFDHDNIIIKLNEGKIHRLESGKWKGGGNTPFGYTYNPKDDILKINPEEAEIVRKAYDMFANLDIPPKKIAKTLGISTEQKVRQMLKRRTYLGYIIYNGIEYKGLHEPIITEELYEKAQKRFADRSNPASKTRYLLSGLLYCKCGKRMRYQQWGGDLKIVCYSRQTRDDVQERKPCDNYIYKAEDVENVVIGQLKRLSYEVSNAPIMTDTHVDIINELNLQIKQKNSELSKLYKLYAIMQDENDEALLNSIVKVKESIVQLKKSLEEEMNQNAVSQEVNRAIELTKNMSDIWDYMTYDEKKTLLRTLVEKVELWQGEIHVFVKLENYLKE